MLTLPAWATFSNEVVQVLPFTGVGDVSAPVWTVQQLGHDGEIKFSVDCSGISAVQVEGGYSLRIPGQSAASPGTPDVPRLAKLFPGVKGAKVHLALRGVDPTNVVSVGVAPAEGFMMADAQKPGRGLRSVRQPDATIFGQNQFWPADIGRVEVASIGTQNVVRVECFPVQYKDATKTIRFFRRLEGSLRFEGGEGSSREKR
jgi:hypothetical protein